MHIKITLQVMVIFAVCLIGILFAFTRIRHRLRLKPIIVVTVCLIGILFTFVRVRYHLLSVNNYFINIDEAEEVRDIVASEFVIGEATKTEIDNALNAGIFGKLDCSHHDEYEFRTDDSDSQTYCDALASYDIFMPKSYVIILRFNGEILIDIRVTISYY